jgi:hypothetical protein
VLTDYVAGCRDVLLCCRPVGIIRLRTETTEFVLFDICRPVGCYSDVSVSSSYTIRVVKGSLHDDRPRKGVRTLYEEQNRSLNITFVVHTAQESNTNTQKTKKQFSVD